MLPEVRGFAIDAMMAMIREDLAALNVSHAVFFSERSLQGAAMAERLLEPSRHCAREA